MAKKSWQEQLAEIAAEYEIKESVAERVKRRLGWEDWGTLLPELVEFAKAEIRRRRWRGGRSGVLPEGYDANSVAAEVVTGALKGERQPQALGWTRERLMRLLKREVSHEVRRLHKLQETRAMRSEWEVLSPKANGELRSLFDGMKGKSMGGWGWDDGQVRDKARKETELRITEALGGGIEGILFGCLRAGVVKRKEIAARLGMNVAEVTNCRKRLDRKLEELAAAGYPRWVIEEWKRR